MSINLNHTIYGMKIALTYPRNFQVLKNIKFLTCGCRLLTGLSFVARDIFIHNSQRKYFPTRTNSVRHKPEYCHLLQHPSILA